MSKCNENPCVSLDCKPAKEKPKLKLQSAFVVKAGVYENVTVEINERCQVVRLEPSEPIILQACDPCA